MKLLNPVFPILAVALILSLFGCGGTSSTRVFVSQWGTEGSGDGEFYLPYGVAVASDGSVYVTGAKNDRIQKFAPAS